MMMRTRYRLSVLLFLSLAPAFALSQEPPRHFATQGVIELGGTFSLQATREVVNGTTSDPVYALAAAPYAGYFLLDGFELGVNPVGVSWKKDPATTTTDVRALAAPSYNWRTGTIVVPFLEGLAGLTVRTASAGGSTTTSSGFSWGGRGGMKISVAGRSLLVLGVQYLVITLNPSGAAERNGEDELSVLAGLTFWW